MLKKKEQRFQISNLTLHQTSRFVLTSPYCFGYLGSFVVPYKCQDCLNSISISVKRTNKHHWNFDSIDGFEEHGRSNNINSSNSLIQDIFPFICVFFHFFHQSFVVFRVQTFNSLIKFILMYFVIFDAIVNEIFFLISFSDTSFLLYRHATDICILISYHATLQNLFISCNWVICC